MSILGKKTRNAFGQILKNNCTFLKIKCYCSSVPNEHIGLDLSCFYRESICF